MQEDEMKNRLDAINFMAADIMQDWLKKIDEAPGELEDELLASVYGGMIAAGLLGYSPQALSNDAEKAIEKLEELVGEREDDSEAINGSD